MIQANVESYCHSGTKDQFFRHLRLTIRSGKVTCLLGLSGVGKTTLLHILLGLEPGTTNGEVVYHIGDRLLSPRQARRNGYVGILTQSAPLVPWLTIRDNLLLPRRMNRRLARPTSTDLQRALSTIGLRPSIFAAYPHQLSRGMAQRVAFARTLAYHPPCLLLDEMFTGLDSASRSLLTNAVRTYVNNHSATCLAITHDVEQAQVLAEEILYLTPDRQIKQLSSHEDRRSLHERMMADLSPFYDASTEQSEGTSR